jgi:cellulose synthase/poly-beta-1,6-N-acetylglucosamine synthase-like glycosyltransferase
MSTIQLVSATGLAAVCLLLSAPNLVVLACLLRRRERRALVRPGESEVPRLLFLVPAHDEELLVGETVRSLLSQDYPANALRVVVIADNCTDRTAEVARRGGAECLERFDPVNRGKPRALAWAIERCPPADVDAVVIIDADTIVDSNFAAALLPYAPLRDCAVQAYFGTLNEWETWVTRLAGVLARGRYEVLYPLKARGGLSCPLLGNGMCIGSGLLPNGWDAFSLTENWELYARYVAAGVPIRYAGAAKLRSQEARSLRQAQTQRHRWLAGRLGVFKTWTRPILASRNASALQKLDALAELGGPSPALHLAIAVVVAGLAALVLPRGAAAVIAGAALLSLLSQCVTTVLVLLRHPQPLVTTLALAMLPGYVVWRSFLALRTMLGSGPRSWDKTHHHEVS